MTYAWLYLFNSRRVTYLKRLLAPFILPYKPARVVDLNCGQAPLATWLLSEGFQVAGNDLSEVIKKLPSQGEWTCTPDSLYDPGPFQILLHLGVSGDMQDLESKTEVEAHLRLVNLYAPKLVVLERCAAYNHSNGHWEILNTFYRNSYSLLKDKSYVYKTDPEWVGHREVAVYEVGRSHV